MGMVLMYVLFPLLGFIAGITALICLMGASRAEIPMGKRLHNLSAGAILIATVLFFFILICSLDVQLWKSNGKALKIQSNKDGDSYRVVTAAPISDQCFGIIAEKVNSKVSESSRGAYQEPLFYYLPQDILTEYDIEAEDLVPGTVLNIRKSENSLGEKYTIISVNPPQKKQKE